MKENKQPKPKKTNEQKRLIASQIAMYCFTGAVVAMLPGLIASNNYSKDIRDFTNDQNAIYEQFMTSDEFGDSFKVEFTKISNDYANGVISYEEFDKKVKHLNSVKYAQEVLASSNNTELKSQVEEIDAQKQKRTDKYNSNIAPNLSLGAMGVGCMATIGATIATMVYTIKESNDEKRKRKKDTHQGVGYYDSTTGKKVTTYYTYDHVEKKTQNTIEEENNEDTLTK